MCGIFGYIGERQNAANLVLDGLSVLEYRGYDSWGIAVGKEARDKNKELRVYKKVGKIGNSTLDSKLMLHDSRIAIGHTRWATHGGVTVANAHPHLDCKKRIALVHNGIVENYKALKTRLLELNHTFLSDTDTEVIAHLIEENLKKHDLVSSVRAAFNACKGLSAIVVLDSESDELVAAKTGSPLIIGVGTNEFFVASDASALLEHTKKAIYLKDGQLAAISREEICMYDLKSGKKSPFKQETIDSLSTAATLGTFEHFMLKEIMEQPEVVLQAATDKAEIKKLAALIKKTKKIFFVAAGTAYHAAVAGAYLFSQAHIPVKIMVASEFEYIEQEVDSHSLVIAFSQSGETIDVIEPLTRAQKKGAKIASILNNKGSTIHRMSDVSVLLHAGPEKAVASTKAYTAKLSVLLHLFYLLLQKEEIMTLLQNSADEEKRLLGAKNILQIQTLAKKLKKTEFMFAIGRGLSYSSALEAALKIKEVSYVHIEGLAGGELKHGSIALIQKGTPCIVFAPQDETHDAIISNATEIKARGGYIIGISPENSDIFDEWIEVKDVGLGSIMAQVIPVQLLAYYLALEKGIEDPDKPRNLAKSVTVK